MTLKAFYFTKQLIGRWRRNIFLRGRFGRALQTVLTWVMPVFNAYKNRITEGGEAPPTEVTFTYRGDVVTYGVVECDNGRLWMDRNLGATRVAQSASDSEAYGHLFQFGRNDDGHQLRDSGATAVLSDADDPGHGDFITTSSSPHDWRSPHNNDLWQYSGTSVNNLDFAPEGWRLPTQAELEAEIATWDSSDSVGAFTSPLKWTVGGKRLSDGSFWGVDSNGSCYSSTLYEGGGYARFMSYDIYGAGTYWNRRSNAQSVRLIKEEGPIGGEIIDEDQTIDIFSAVRKLWDNLVFAISSQAGIAVNDIGGDDHVQAAFDMSQEDNDALQTTAVEQPELLWDRMQFDGTDDSLDAGTAASLDLGTGDFTIAGLIYPPSTKTADNTIISRGDSGTGEWAVKILNSDNTLVFDDVLRSTSGYVGGEKFFAAVRDGATGVLYIDDRSGGEGSFAGKDYNTSKTMLVGKAETSDFYGGGIRTLLVLNKGLSEAEVDDLEYNMWRKHRFWVFLYWDNTQTTPAIGVHDGLIINLSWDNTQTDPAITVT